MPSTNVSSSRSQVEITSVSQNLRRFTFKARDGRPVTGTIVEIPNLFVWPNVGERWIVERKGTGTNVSWQLISRIEPPDETLPVENMDQGTAKINSTQVYLRDGTQVISTPATLPLNITGSKSDGTAFANLLEQLVAAGVITDSTTA